MEISFNHTSAGLFVALSFLAATGISYLLYFYNPQNTSLTLLQKLALATLRWATLFLVFLLLLSPLIEQTQKIKQLPILAVAIDNSQSVSSFSESIKQLQKDINDRFSDNYRIEFWNFGEKVEKSEMFTGSDRRSDYGLIIKALKNSYINKNIGALILVGDGIYNQGQNPLNLAPGLKFPVYSIGIGDTTQIVDAVISNVRTNKVAFLKNRFPVEIELKFSKLKNKIAYIDIENNQKQIYSSTISIGSDDDFKLEFVNIEASEAGLQHYKIKIRQLEGEINLKNNEYEFVIQVLEDKQKILMLSDGLHPDLGAIRNSLSELQNYDIKTITGTEIPDSLSSYSLIILNQLPGIKNSASQLLSRIKDSRIPVLFLVGPATLTEQLNTLNVGVKISPNTNTEEVQPRFDENFSFFVLSNETKELLETAPPLLAPFGDTNLSPFMQNLSFQSIKNIPTNKSLIAFGSEKGRKVGFILGEGLWRWRLYCYQANGDHEAFNELIQKSVQYLALKENEDNFNVYHPALYQETDNIELTAELYNDSYELINAPDVNIRIKNSNSNELNFQFDRIQDYYRLNAGNLEPGDYTFEAETQLGNQNFLEQGSFSIVRNDQEIQNTRANFDVLYQLSLNTGGSFTAMANYGILLDEVASNKQIAVQYHKQPQQTEWINLKTIFLLLVVLLGVEWFFRKFWGTY